METLTKSRTKLYRIYTDGLIFNLRLNEDKCAKFIFSFAQHLEWKLKQYGVAIKGVSRDSMTMIGTYIEDKDFVKVLIKEIKDYYE